MIKLYLCCYNNNLLQKDLTEALLVKVLWSLTLTHSAFNAFDTFGLEFPECMFLDFSFQTDTS
jgi:hypothetical protein